MWWYLIILLGGLWLLHFLWNAVRTTANLPPLAPGIPIFGNPQVIENSYKTLADLGLKLGGLYRMHLFGMQLVHITEWTIMKSALVEQSDAFSGRPPFFVTQQVSRGNDVVSIDGPAWKAKRCITINHLRNLGFGKTSMEDSISEEIAKVTDILERHGGHVVAIKGLFYMPILNILWSLVTGKKYDYSDRDMVRLQHLIRSHFTLLSDSIPLNALPFLRFLPGDPFSYHRLMRHTREVEAYARNERNEHALAFQTESEPRTFIDAYLADILGGKGKRYNGTNADHAYQKKHLIGTTLDLLLAGTDTSQNILEWGFLYMGVWPEIQDRVQQELDTVIGRGRQPSYEDISRLPYTEATILEIHRYASILPMSVPHRTITNAVLNGYTIPAKTTVVFNLWAVNHDEKLWGDPRIFRPERFLGVDGTVHKPEHLIPFLVGARSCIGSSLARMQLFLFFASLLHKFSFRRVSGEEPPSLSPKVVSALSIEPMPFHLVVRERVIKTGGLKVATPPK